MRVLVVGFLVSALSSCGQTDQERKTPGSDSTKGSIQETPKSLAEMSSSEKEALKESLMNEGKYDCCSKPGCTLCIGNKQECSCYLDIKRKDPICGECFEAYKAGNGKLKLVSIVELEEIRKKRGAR